MIILDTNVLSALMRQTPDKNVVVWLDKQPRTSVWTTSVTILEVRFGLQIMPLGKRRSVLMQAFGSCSRQDWVPSCPIRWHRCATGGRSNGVSAKERSAR
jgi:hypothetical protein